MHHCPRGLRERCRLLGYSTQAYYQYHQGLVRRNLGEELLLEQVRRERALQPRLGARKLLVRLAAFMQAHELQMGRDAFFALLKANGLLIRSRGSRRPRTTFSGHGLHKYPDLLKGLEVIRPEQAWVSDLTYIGAGRGFAYLSLVTDAYSRKIVGYHLSGDLSAAGPLRALEMALSGRSGRAPLLHHSDRGCQYCSLNYVKLLEDHQVAISMTQSGDPRENAIAERVNGVLKGELLAGHYGSFCQAAATVKAAVELYNHHRPHSSVAMLTPALAHQGRGELSRRWKSYYKSAAKEVDKPG